jgi:endoglucanase
VILVEEDAIDTSGCLSRHGLANRKKLLGYEIGVLAQVPHAVVYVDGGTEDGNSARFAAKILNAAGVRRIRGFFLNATHRNWTSKEIAFGKKISKLTHGSHFIINTADNGHGPKLNRHPSTQVDAFEWTAVPGKSAGFCHPGDPSGGVFSVKLALGLAERANGKLGPGYPSKPY